LVQLLVFDIASKSLADSIHPHFFLLLQFLCLALDILKLFVAFEAVLAAQKADPRQAQAIRER
jgi:hypothetical protein